MMHIAEVLPAEPSPLWRMVQQCGVNHVVGSPNLRPGDGKAAREAASIAALRRLKEAFENGGFKLAVIESRPPMEKIKLGLPGRDEEVDTVCLLIRNMGKLGIPVWCYEWMPVFNWLRTSTATESRGGALVTAYDHSEMQKSPPSSYAPISEETLWKNLEYFLKIVIPVAEDAGVKLAMHPDDPPISPVRGLGRIMRSVENYRRLINLVPSEVNGIALCQGNFTLMTDDLPSVIREFGHQKKIFFVHFRDVRGTADNFVETFHDDGKTDMLACMQAYKETGFDGVCRPDHVPTMEGDDNNRPGYSSIGRLFAIGYLRGLQEAVYGRGPTGTAVG